MALVKYFSEETAFKLKHPKKTSDWILSVVSTEGASLESLNYIFCSDKFLLELNTSFLKHQTLTDIITFDLSEEKGLINGEIYISVERVKENSSKFASDFDIELHRVIIHGVLHLLGYKDKSPSQKLTMRKKEEAFLSLRK